MPKKGRKKMTLNKKRVREWRVRRNYPTELLYGLVAKRLLNNVHMADLRGARERTSTVVALDSPDVVSFRDFFRLKEVAKMIEERAGGEIGFSAEEGKIVDKEMGELASISIAAYPIEKGKLLSDLNMRPVNALLRKLRKVRALDGL